MEDELDAVAIGDGAEDGGADAAQAEGEADEEAGHGADFAGDEFLGVNENRGEHGGEDQANDRAQDGARSGNGKYRTTSRQSELDRIKRSSYRTLARSCCALTSVVRIRHSGNRGFSRSASRYHTARHPGRNMRPLPEDDLMAPG